MTDLEEPELLRLGLHDLHVELGGKMVPFAGYEMPVQYPAGVMKEHLHTRAAAGLFDVSHMGQVILRPKGGDGGAGAGVRGADAGRCAGAGRGAAALWPVHQ